MNIKPYIAICRFDHWIKNLFVAPGLLLYLYFYRVGPGAINLLSLGLGLLAVSLIASANYVLNEILDCASDRFHPEKQRRPIPSGQVRLSAAWSQWVVLTTLGLAAGFAIGVPMGLTMLVFWLAGVSYNVPPVRLKDRTYGDVISESINNPLRLLAGWYMAGALGALPPPISVIMAYWMFGAYLMAIKRYAEYRFINNPETAGQYRKSFRGYSLEKLQESIVFYASAFAFFSGVFIARYRIELVAAIPLVAYCMAYYFHIGFRENSPVQHPEQLYRERKLMLIVGITFVACAALLLLDIPALQQIFDPRVPSGFMADR